MCVTSEICRNLALLFLLFLTFSLFVLPSKKKKEINLAGKEAIEIDEIDN